MGLASNTLLEQLHKAVGQGLAQEIAKYTQADGEYHGTPLPPALIGQAIKFLKDNGIEALPTADNGMEDLVNEIPQFDHLDDDNDEEYG
jgi:hypothetical protein